MKINHICTWTKPIRFGLASYNKNEIQNNSDFYNEWHKKEYYEDYLTLNENETSTFLPVYQNQKDDSHPPFYYLILRIAMGFNVDKYSKWTGIVINIIIYMFITIFMYLIISKLLKNEEKYKEKSAILAFISSIMLSAITNVIFIRMYALSTLNIVITTYLHLKLLDCENKNNRILVAIGILALLGSLTHYYYLFYLLAIFMMFIIKYVKEKKFKQLGKYILAFVISGILSLIIFPYSINHIFFSYRGQGVLNNFTNMYQYLINITLYLIIANIYIFNNFLVILLLGISIICICKLIKHKKIVKTKNKYIRYIVIPTLFYFIIVAICSPFIEIRYILPISPMIFILVIYLIYNILQTAFKSKTANIIMLFIILVMFIMAFLSNNIIDIIVGKKFRSEQESLYSSKTDLVENLKSECNLSMEILPKIEGIPLDNVLLYIKNFNVEPETMYSNKRDIMEKVTRELKNVPALYLLNSNNNRFLDDILLFANINESYIAKDIECTEENIKEILKYKDISNGVLIFINDLQDNEKILDTIQKTTNLYDTIYLKRLNMCDVYYIK